MTTNIIVPQTQLDKIEEVRKELNSLAGYLRDNDMPYSAIAILTETDILYEVANRRYKCIDVVL